MISMKTAFKYCPKIGSVIFFSKNHTRPKGMQENPERSGTERNGTEPEVIIMAIINIIVE